MTASQIKTLVNTAPVFAAGTASAGTHPLLTAGTLLTTAEVGAIELDADALYATTDAGNRGYVPVRHFIRTDSAYTLTSATTEQKLFNSPTNGTLTLETGTYLFDMAFYLTAMSATTGNAAIDPLGAGTAVINDWLWLVVGNDGNAGTASNQSGVTVITQQTSASAVGTATGTAMSAFSRGTFTVTTAGTIIPSITLVTAAAAIVAAGSYFFCERIGSTSVVSVGQWS